jgi:micrococcal nuclease
VGIDTPEIGEEGYEEAKEFVNRTCLGEAVKLDVDDKEQYDPHYRILAVVYVNETNLNEKLVKEGYAEVMYIPPSEFDSREWVADYTPFPTPIPGFELLFAIIGVVAALYLVRRRG